ncbi:hypothetical protein PAPYR_10835 [Paratrimastix pyriformis]|uniref:Uncharacterized protein n=1 Tax=Paratrimastix pyriformis TaxID=342808 RepID=A0ABQ8UAX4_9EUKA|nr:hypothetical protein PAPYR_10835 [Paratrimastix pyriformis]
MTQRHAPTNSTINNTHAPALPCPLFSGWWVVVVGSRVHAAQQNERRGEAGAISIRFSLVVSSGDCMGPTLGPALVHFGVCTGSTWGLHWVHFGYGVSTGSSFGSAWGHVGATHQYEAHVWGQYQADSEEPHQYWDHVGVNIRSAMTPIWGQCCAQDKVGRAWGQHGVIMGSALGQHWGQYGVSTGVIMGSRTRTGRGGTLGKGSFRDR